MCTLALCTLALCIPLACTVTVYSNRAVLYCRCVSFLLIIYLSDNIDSALAYHNDHNTGTLIQTHTPLALAWHCQIVFIQATCCHSHAPTVIHKLIKAATIPYLVMLELVEKYAPRNARDWAGLATRYNARRQSNMPERNGESLRQKLKYVVVALAVIIVREGMI